MRVSPGGKIYYVNVFGEKIEDPIDLQKSPYINYDYMPLRICPRWYYWQDSYNFLPVPDYWEAIIKRVVGSWNSNMTEQVDPDAKLPLYKAKVEAGVQKLKNPSEIIPLWDTLQNEEYYILASSENVMTVILQNRKQYDWIRPDCVFFFGRNSFSPKGLEWAKNKVEYEIEFYRRNNDGKDPDKFPPVSTAEMPTLYWVRSWRYINVGNLFAEVILEKCYIWQYFGNWMNTWFNAKVNKSQINNDHISYGGFPIVANNEPGKPARKVHQLHWPMDEDWYVVRKKNPEDEGIYKIESNESNFPPLKISKWFYNNIIKIGGVSDKYPVKEPPNNDFVTVSEGWLQDSSGKTVWGKLPSDYILDESIAPAHNCPACDACFDFCGDLRIKKAMNSVMGCKIKKEVSVEDGKGGTRKLMKTDHSDMDPSREWKEVPTAGAWQPGDGKYYKVIYTFFPQDMKQIFSFKGATSASVICDEEGNMITAVPSNIHLMFWERTDNLLETSSKVPSIVFLVDYNHQKVNKELFKDVIPAVSADVYGQMTRTAMITSSARRGPLNLRKFYWDFLPKPFSDEPHLLVHSVAQFFFQYNLLFTANLKHLWVRRKAGGFALGYRVNTRSSIAGILYMFESLDIFYKWELKVRGSIQNNSLFNQSIASIQGRVMGKIKEATEKVLDLGMDAWTGGFWSKGKKWLGMGGGDDKEKTSKSLQSIAKSLNSMSGGAGDIGDDDSGVTSGNDTDKGPMNSKEYAEGSGLGTEPSDINEDHSDKDAQTERKAKATGKTKEKETKPAIFYTNTIDFSYDFWEFANRCVADPFFVRFEYSEILYNNLVNNNNASPIQNLDNRGNRFCQIVKKGDFQGQVKLGFDPRGIFSGICAKGTTWYDEGTDWDANGNIVSDWWVPWVPQYKALQSYTLGAVFNTSTQQGTEDTSHSPGKKEKKGETKTNPGDALNGFRTWVELEQESFFKDVCDAIIRHYPGFIHTQSSYPKKLCWGCSYNNDQTGKNASSLEIRLAKGTKWSYRMKPKYNSGEGLEDGDIKKGECDGPCTFVISGPGKAVYFLKESPGETNTKYKVEVVDALNVQNFASRENKEPVWTDRNMSSNSGIGNHEPDKMPEIPDPEKEAREKQMDKPEPEARERGGDMEKEYQTERDKESERQKERENEREQQKEEEREKERQEEQERQQENEKQKEEQRDKEKQIKERQKVDKERKDKAERLKREAQTRDKREKQKKEREKKQKERERG